jgi:hypothetical protein
MVEFLLNQRELSCDAPRRELLHARREKTAAISGSEASRESLGRAAPAM